MKKTVLEKWTCKAAGTIEKMMDKADRTRGPLPRISYCNSEKYGLLFANEKATMLFRVPGQKVDPESCKALSDIRSAESFFEKSVENWKKPVAAVVHGIAKAYGAEKRVVILQDEDAAPLAMLDEKLYKIMPDGAAAFVESAKSPVLFTGGEGCPIAIICPMRAVINESGAVEGFTPDAPDAEKKPVKKSRLFSVQQDAQEAPENVQNAPESAEDAQTAQDAQESPETAQDAPETASPDNNADAVEKPEETAETAEKENAQPVPASDYVIERNEKYNSTEIRFTEKPARAVLDALKKAGFRWNGKRGIWYGFTDAEDAVRMIEDAREEKADGGETWQDIPGATTAPRGKKWQNNGKSRFSADYKHRLADKDPAPVSAPVSAEKRTPQSRVKIYYNGLKVAGMKSFYDTDLLKCGYAFHKADGNYYKEEEVRIYAEHCHLPRDLFNVENNSDCYTDYFENDGATVKQDHPLYKYIKYAAFKVRAVTNRRHISGYLNKQLAKPCEPWRGAFESYRQEKTRLEAEIAEFEKMQDPGQPCAEDLEKIDRQRQEEENRRREEEHQRELEDRERVLAQRIEGREYIEAVSAAHPIEDGAPVVSIPYSEAPYFYSYMREDREKITLHPDGTKTEEVLEKAPRCVLSVAAADIVLKHFDDLKVAGGGGYYKTDFIITWTDETGEPCSYEGRYDLGDGDGGMIQHIRGLGEWYKTHDAFWHEKAEPDETSEQIQVADFLQTFTEPKKEPPHDGGGGEGVTRSWKIHGREGHRQRESFRPSCDYDFSSAEEGVRKISVSASDRTGTNDFVIVTITRQTWEECEKELDGQLSDGIFENSRIGRIEEIQTPEKKAV